MVMLPRVFVLVLSGYLGGSGALLLMVGVSLFVSSSSLSLSWDIPLLSSAELSGLLLVDSISASFLGSVGLISSAVLMFSCSYMSGEKYFLRFHLLVLSFVLSMAMLILSPNLVSLLLGWDGLGVTSFLLVIYFQSAKSYNAGLLTVLSNRVGDLLILMAIAVNLQLGNWNLFMQTLGDSGALSEVVLLVSCATLTKSAQIPFSAWLPAAMAAPTPVSSLVHSSTLVTAGVYLLIRLTDLVGTMGLTLPLLVVGSGTMLMAGVSAIYEVDMKKIVALSTLSQLGLMVSAVGLGAWELAFAHLLAHAYFKALLFMAVGNMIHMADDFQDMRKASLSTLSASALMFSGLANASLCGLPFLSGFYSKDWILESSLTAQTPSYLLVTFFAATLLTAAYSLRFVLLCWLATCRKTSLSWESDSDPLMRSCCMALLPLAVAGGAMLLGHMQLSGAPSLSPLMKNLTLAVVISGFLTPMVLRMWAPGFSLFCGRWSWGLMWSLPGLSAPSFLSPSLPLSAHSRQQDLGWTSTLALSSLVSHGALSNESASSLSIKFMALPLSAAGLLLGLYVY